MKSGNILYLFDMDGTLFGKEVWKGIKDNYITNFKSKLYINPARFDIRWSILTGRPKIDKPIIKLWCIFKGIFPEKIITINKWKYPFITNLEKYEWKYNVIKSILDSKENKDIPKYNYNRELLRVVYIDNDLETNKYINMKRRPNIIAVTVADFINGTYTFLL